MSNSIFFFKLKKSHKYLPNKRDDFLFRESHFGISKVNYNVKKVSTFGKGVYKIKLKSIAISFIIIGFFIEVFNTPTDKERVSDFFFTYFFTYFLDNL
jgi:hypothetical protein